MHKNGFFITNYIDNLIGCDVPVVALKAFKFRESLVQE